MKNLTVNDDGAALVDGFVPASIDMKGLTWGAPSLVFSYLTGASSAVVDVWLQDFMAFVVKHAYARELPQAVFDVMAADLDGPLAVQRVHAHPARMPRRTLIYLL